MHRVSIGTDAGLAPAMLPVQDPPQAVLPFSTVRLRL